MQCQSGYLIDAVGVNCQTVCGDGLISGNEQCDSGSVYQAGCLNCVVMRGYTCSGRPSVCT